MSLLTMIPTSAGASAVPDGAMPMWRSRNSFRPAPVPKSDKRTMSAKLESRRVEKESKQKKIDYNFLNKQKIKTALQRNAIPRCNLVLQLAITN